MKKIKIAQIGTGHDHALPTYKAVMKLGDMFEMVGVAEPNPDRSVYPDVPKVYTVEQLLDMEDLDAVLIECEEENATKYAQMFADRGKAIHLDKPGSQDKVAFERLINTLKKYSIPFQMGYMYRYNPMIKRCIQEAKSGRLGEIFSIEGQMSVCHNIEKRRWLGKYKGGMMYFLGCHLIDIILQIQGTPENIIVLNKCTDEGQLMGAEDYGFAVFEYKNGTSFVKTSASEVNGFGRRQIVVCGAKGSYEIRPIEDAIEGGDEYRTVSAKIAREDEISNIWLDCGKTERIDKFPRYDTMMSDFAAYIRGEKVNPYSYDYELELFNTILKCCGMEREENK